MRDKEARLQIDKLRILVFDMDERLSEVIDEVDQMRVFRHNVSVILRQLLSESSKEVLDDIELTVCPYCNSEVYKVEAKVDEV